MGVYTSFRLARSRVIGLVAAVLSAAAACTKSPTGPAVSVVSGRASTPADGAQISFYAQPVSVSIDNGGAADAAAAVTDTVQVATDAAFAAIVVSLDVPQAAGPTTLATLPPLAPATQYFWRVRSAAGGNDAPFTAGRAFTIGPRVVLGAPVVVQPQPSAFVPLRPTFVVANVSRLGPSGHLLYQFDVSTQASMTPLVAASTVAEGVSQTTFTPSADLDAATTYFWRVRATDAATQESGPAATASFVTPLSGAAMLKVHNGTGCNSLNTDLGFAGAVRLQSDKLTFSQEGSSTLTLIVPATGAGSINGYGVGGAQGQRFNPGVPPGLAVQIALAAPGVVQASSFTDGGQISGTFSATFKSYNQFNEYGTSCAGSGFQWALSPR